MFRFDFFFFFFTLVTGPRRSLGLKLSDTRVYTPQIRARLGTTTHFCEAPSPHQDDDNMFRFDFSIIRGPASRVIKKKMFKRTPAFSAQR